jgi:hypothetical protein
MIRPNGADAPLAVLALELDHHINHLMGEVQDVFAGELPYRIAYARQSRRAPR